MFEGLPKLISKSSILTPIKPVLIVRLCPPQVIPDPASLAVPNALPTRK